MGKEELAAGCCILCMLTLATVLVAAYAFFIPVQVTVDEASLRRLALATPAGNGTAFFLAYDLSLAVAVHNPNWAMRVWRAGPLDADLRFGGLPFARGRLGSVERDRIRERRQEVYRAAAAAEGVPLALGRDGAAEFAKESAAGVFEMELIVAGEVRYQAHFRRRSFRANCPLKLSLSTAMAPAAFARVKCK